VKITIEQIDTFLAGYNAGFKPATCRNHRSYLRGFLKYLYYDRQILKRDLAVLLIGAPNFAKANPPKFLPLRQVKQLFGMLSVDSAKDLRCAAMVHLAYTLGLRPKEISRIRLDDIAFGNGEIAIPDRKSTQPIRLPLPEVTIKAVAAYIVGGRPASELRELFLTLRPPYRPVTPCLVSKDIAAVVCSVNPGASAYWLRHTYAQNLLESGASIFEVKQMMGHDSLNTTRRYLHIHVKLMREVLFDETL
jgi:site-specific recombinase XerD